MVSPDVDVRAAGGGLPGRVASADYQAGCERVDPGRRVRARSFSNPQLATDSEDHEVRVWGLETLLPLHTLKQPPGAAAGGAPVHSHASGGGEVLGAVGEEMVVWGRLG